MSAQKMEGANLRAQQTEEVGVNLGANIHLNAKIVA